MSGSPRGQRPPAGTEAAAAALLGWLTDPDAPRLCLLTGGPERGKTALLAWLATYGARSGGRRRRSARAVVPLAGQSALGAAWALANRLGVVARTPGELVRVLATTESRRAVLLLTDLQSAAEPDACAELLAELAESGRVRLVVETGPQPPGPLTARRAATVSVDGGAAAPAGPRPGEAEPGPDPADPVAVCTADPVRVTTAYAADPEEEHGGLRAAWLRAGQSLSRDQDPADRALVLLGSLGDGADPRLRPALAELAAAAPWRVRWTRVRGDLTPPWPGPATSLGVGRGGLLVAGPTETVTLLDPVDAHPVGEPATSPGGRVKALAPAPDGAVLLLDERGRLHTVRGSAPRPPYLERLTEAVTATLSRHPGTALAAIAGSVVVGDRLGSVHAFGLTGVHQAALHSGRVTAVTAVETATPFVCSGGADGTVRVWVPGQDPKPGPLTAREAAVVDLHATPTAAGPALAVAWADGLVELHHLDSGTRLAFRPGPPVRAVAVTPDGALVIGMDEVLVRLDPAGPENG
ncbi:hypothetical protein [Streptomyces sp. NPDC047434]|uniref:WD40 repeat domain-containing protein n=1 Tax=Streptomyces sp. NPDC047434 TaxID=3155143 RepID=UPI003403DCCA